MSDGASQSPEEHAAQEFGVLSLYPALPSPPMLPPSPLAAANPVMKGRSSRLLREEFPALQMMPSPWTRSYFISTAGNVSQAIIQKYIEAQSRQ